MGKKGVQEKLYRNALTGENVRVVIDPKGVLAEQAQSYYDYDVREIPSAFKGYQSPGFTERDEDRHYAAPGEVGSGATIGVKLLRKIGSLAVVSTLVIGAGYGGEKVGYNVSGVVGCRTVAHIPLIDHLIPNIHTLCDTMDKPAALGVKG